MNSLDGYTSVALNKALEARGRGTAVRSEVHRHRSRTADLFGSRRLDQNRPIASCASKFRPVDRNSEASLGLGCGYATRGGRDCEPGCVGSGGPGKGVWTASRNLDVASFAWGIGIERGQGRRWAVVALCALIAVVLESQRSNQWSPQVKSTYSRPGTKVHQRFEK
jgi:hypothetical protein